MGMLISQQNVVFKVERLSCNRLWPGKLDISSFQRIL